MNPRTHAMLGRSGDVINLLPVLKARRDEIGKDGHLLVAREFASILDGTSYVDAVEWNGPWQDCMQAIDKATAAGADVLNCCVYGLGYKFHRRCAAFDREAWNNAGAPAPWGHLPLVFDLRDEDREMNVISALDAFGDYVVTCFSGVSTPFSGGGAVLATLRAHGLRVVDVSDYRAERIYDLLNVLERAACLVSSDSALLHLAAAVPELPVVSLVQDRAPRWQRSSWRPQHVARIDYSAALLDPEAVADAVKAAQSGPGPGRRFQRVCSHVGRPDANDLRRMRVAQASWHREREWARCWLPDLEVPEHDLRRTTRTVYGEARGCPYYKDLIELACARLQPRDVVVLCNADVGVTPGFTGWALEAIQKTGALFTHRWDYDIEIKEPFVSEAQVCEGRWYPGSDCWAFTVAWWRQYQHRFPDMAMGREAGDMVLRHLIKNAGGVEVPGAIWHEKHPSFWEHWGNKDLLPSNRENRRLARAFLAEWGGDWNDGREVRP